MAPSVTPNANKDKRTETRTLSSKDDSIGTKTITNLPTSVEIENVAEDEDTSVGMASGVRATNAANANSASRAFNQMQQVAQTNFFHDHLPIKRYIKEKFFPMVSIKIEYSKFWSTNFVLLCFGSR